MQTKRLVLFIIILIAAYAGAEIYLPHTGLSVTTNFAARGPMDAWDTPAVICSTETGCADVVFVVDTSGSMAGKISELYTEIGEFAFTLESEGYDGAYGVATFVNTTNFPAGDTLFTDPDDFADFMSGLSGADGGFEQPTDATYDAIDQYFVPAPDTCKKVAICITDETEDGSSHSVASLISWACAVPGTCRVYLVSPSGHPMEPACAGTGGRWFDIDSYSLDDVLESVADDIAEFTAVTITVHNNTGGPISDAVVEINPWDCISLDFPGDSIQNTGPIAAGDSAIVSWSIDEDYGCHGCGDCFTITVDAGAYADTVTGCLFVEGCDCPGINANVIVPRTCGGYTACDELVFQFEGCFIVDPNTIVVDVNGSLYYYPDPRMTFNAADQTLTFVPSSPWPDGTHVQFYVQDAYDITGCQLRYSQECDFYMDSSPPVFDGGPNWSPPCGSMIEDTDVIHFDACVHDNGIGLTPLDGGIGADDLTFESLFSVFYSVYLEINGGIFGGDSIFELPGIPGVPGLGYDALVTMSELGFPPGCDTLADSSATLYTGFPFTGFFIYRLFCNNDLDIFGACPDCDDCEWRVQFDVPAGEIRSIVGDPPYLELCFHFADLITEDDCGPNDTAVCCMYYFETVECADAVTEVLCPSPDCFQASSCEPQPISFAMVDTTSRVIDHDETWFTVTVFPDVGGPTSYVVNGADAHITWSAVGDTCEIMWSPIADGDSVVITLDSLFTTDGCKTIP